MGLSFSCVFFSDHTYRGVSLANLHSCFLNHFAQLDKKQRRIAEAALSWETGLCHKGLGDHGPVTQCLGLSFHL